MSVGTDIVFFFLLYTTDRLKTVTLCWLQKYSWRG